ncbi:MAG: response regulator transcription factor [Anaerolineae bacterium]|nr:response regulator transcription factor [Anaerolineae bacterium]
MKNLSLLLVSDDPLARAGLAYLLTEQLHYQIAEQINSQTWLDSSDFEDEVLPDAVVWDLGWEISLSVSELEPSDMPVLALVSDEELAAEIWSAGIRAIVRRDAEPEQVDAALQAVVKGFVVLEPTFVAQLFAVMVGGETGMQENLTPRELEVLKLLAEGNTNKAIAQQLEVSSHTVKFHVNGLMGKLNAQSRTEAVVRATRLGLIAL